MPDRIGLFIALCLPVFVVGADMLGIAAVIEPVMHTFPVSPMALSLLVTLCLLGLAMTIFPARALCRVIQPRYVLMSSLLVFAIAAFIGANAHNIVMVMVIRFFQGVGLAGIMAAVMTLLPSYLERKQRPIMARYVAAWSVIGIAVGPIISGICVQYGHWHFWFMVSGVIALFAMIMVIWQIPKIKVANKEQPYLTDICRRPRFVRALAGSFVGYAIVFVWLFLFALYLPRVMGDSPLQVSLAYLPFSIAFAITAYQIHSVIKQFGLRLTLTCLLLIVVLALALLLLTNSLMPYWAFLSLFVLLGVGSGGLSVGMMVYGLAGLDKKNRGDEISMVILWRCLGGIVGISVAVVILTWLGRYHFYQALSVYAIHLPVSLSDKIALLLPGPVLLHRALAAAHQFDLLSYVLSHAWGEAISYCMVLLLVLSLALLACFVYVQRARATMAIQRVSAEIPAAWSWPKTGLLLIACLVFLLGSCDINIIVYTLPRMTQPFEYSASHIKVLLICFGVGYASVLILSGYWADRYGYRKPFLAGLMLLLLSSLTGGMIYFSNLLLFSTAVLQGMGLGLAWPGVQVIVMREFSGRQQRLAMGIIFMSAGIGMSIAALLGGSFAASDAWNAFMLITGLSALCIWLLAYGLFPKKVARYPAAKMGLLSAVLVFLASVAFLYGLHLAILMGLSNLNAWVWMLVGLVLGLISLVYRLLRYQHSLLWPLLSKGHYLSGLVCRAAALYSYILIYFMLTMYLTNMLAFNLSVASMVTLPLFAVSIISAPLFGQFAKGSPRAWLFLGMLITLAGLAWLVLDTALFGHIPYWFIPFIMMGFGLGIVFPASNLFALRAVDKNHIGLASGVLYFISIVSTGFAIVVSVMISRSGVLFQLQHHFLKQGLNMELLSQPGFAQAVGKMQLVQYIHLHWPAKIAVPIIASINDIYQHAFQYAGVFAIVLMLFAMAFLGVVKLSEYIPDQDKIKHAIYPCF